MMSSLILVTGFDSALISLRGRDIAGIIGQDVAVQRNHLHS